MDTLDSTNSSKPLDASCFRLFFRLSTPKCVASIILVSERPPRTLPPREQMAGASWVASVNSLTVQKRSRNAPLLITLAEACQPNYVALTACVGDCHSATQTFTQVPFTCTSLPQNVVVNCSSSMPCTCSILDFPLDPSVVTCGNCDATPEGQRCFFVCVNPADQLTSQSVRSIQCMKTGWNQIPPASKPICAAIVPTCPPLVSTNEYVTDFSAKCVGAVQNDICRISCNAGYFSPSGWFNATCTQVGSELRWNRELSCQCQPCREFGDIDCPDPSQVQFNQSLV